VANGGKFTITEAVEKFPTVMELINTIADGVEQAELDGKVTGAEMGDLMAIAFPKLGRLVDEIIADCKD
jgi:hypothetical protein